MCDGFRPSNLIGLSFVSLFWQHPCRHRRHVTRVYHAYLRFPRWQIKSALPGNCSLKIQQTLHEEIRSQEGVRNLHPFDVVLHTTVISLESTSCVFVRSQ